MDETTEVVASADQIPAPDVASVDAGIDAAEADIMPVDRVEVDAACAKPETESFISSAPAETAESAPAETNSETLTEIEAAPTEVEAEILSSEAVTPCEVAISSDALSVADALTSVDDSQTAEELTSANVKATAEIDAAAKAASVDDVKSSAVVCELEEELKRLHEGEPMEHEEPTVEISPAVEKSATQEKVVIPLQAVPVPQVEKTEKKVTVNVNVQVAVEESNPAEMLSADDVAKDPVLIKNAQEDMKKIDVLVCGHCHEVFHFVEDFQSHKSKKCSGKSSLLSTCDGENKPQVWGFTLWKNRQSKAIKEGETMPSSWIIYQKWCKLPQTDKDAWIKAGQTLQVCSKISAAKVTEVKSRAQPRQEKDPLALDGFGDSNKENSLMGNAPVEKSTASEVIKKSIVKPVRLNNDVTILPSTKNGDLNSNKALRTVRSMEKREYVVERIVAKRFNPKKKTWEYQIKWENFPSEDNTWEPVSNLNHCKQMVEEFEEQLKKLKAQKAKQQQQQQAAVMLSKNRVRPMKPISSPMSSYPSSSFSNDPTPRRPQRTSKQKAVNQVKAWCGNISDTDEGGLKRAFEDDDSDDSFEKKMKYEEYSEDSDADVKPKPPLRKIAPKPSMQVIKNGVGKQLSPLPQNVLIPDANGVVRINQKQLPSLSTGVYIMSKTAGIIKLDSTTSKVATSGGQTIVKVAPKIGQTQIKIVKKDGATTTTKQIIHMAPNRTPAKIYKPVITKVKKPPELPPKATPAKIIVKPKEELKPPPPDVVQDEESDDGLEELPFPEDLPEPEPASPEPKEFVLDPFTGKIAGQEYPEAPVPDPDDLKMDTEDASSLENIVKLAAADITEDDLKTDPAESPMEHEPIVIPEEVKPVVKFPRTISTPRKIVMTPTIIKSEPSLLNKALRGSAVVRKGWLGTSPQQPARAQQQRVQQKVLNQSVAAKSQGSFVRSVPHASSFARTRPTAPKPKFNIAGCSNIIRSQHEATPRNVYPKAIMSGVTRKIGNTTIRSTSYAAAQRPAARIVQCNASVRKASPRKEAVTIRTPAPEKIVAVASKPKTVISMPSLIGDDEPVLSLSQPEASKPSPALPVAKMSPTPAAASAEESAPEETDASASSLTADISSFTLADNENPIYITGDDGTVYQVAGQNEHGQTILLTQGSDGQQQCLLVTNEVAETMESAAEEEAVQEEVALPEISTDVTEPLSVKTDSADTSDQVVAQVVRAEPPSPGGTHKVVVMLPDGNLMITQVSPEEYASLELE